MSLDIVILGLSITSSWGNGHATTYRGLVRELVRRGHAVTFLERDVPWYAAHRDLAAAPFGRTVLYGSLDELRTGFADQVRRADLVIVGSFVPDGIAVGEWAVETARGVVAFYDIDTPVTLAMLEQGEQPYLSPGLVAAYDLYLSFTGGRTLDRLEQDFGARLARPLYCSADPAVYYPEPRPVQWDLGYLGTYSRDRQPKLDRLMLTPARRWPAGRFAVAGPQYPDTVDWPANVERFEHLAPDRHRAFYTAQRFALNLTRADMAAAGWSPSIRLFEAAACGAAIISDRWEGLDGLLEPGCEIIVVDGAEQVLDCLRNLSEAERRAIGTAARERVLASHTAAHRAAELERYFELALQRRRRPQAVPASVGSLAS